MEGKDEVCFPPEGGVNAPAHGGTIDAPGIFQFPPPAE